MENTYDWDWKRSCLIAEKALEKYRNAMDTIATLVGMQGYRGNPHLIAGHVKLKIAELKNYQEQETEPMSMCGGEDW